MAQHITGAGWELAHRSGPVFRRDLDDRQSALFLPRGQNGSINVALKELEAVREDLDRTEHQPEEYWAAHEARMRLAAEITGLEEVVADLKQRAAQYEKRLKSRPLDRTPQGSSRRLWHRFPSSSSFRKVGSSVSALLNKQIRRCNPSSKPAAARRNSAGCAAWICESQADPAEYERRVRIIESLRSLLPRVDATRRVYAASIERLHATTQENAAHESAMAGVRPPSQISVFMFIGLIWCGAVGIALAGHLYSALALIAVSLTPLWWYRRRHGRVCRSAPQTCGLLRTRCESAVTKSARWRMKARGIESGNPKADRKVGNLSGRH